MAAISHFPDYDERVEMCLRVGRVDEAYEEFTLWMRHESARAARGEPIDLGPPLRNALALLAAMRRQLSELSEAS